ncbi:hypothetical protein [Mangrovimonas spongiae]|uniref:Uncharacterized protein n=1 Tax=Mangrovimonas spongiae TaxID=2494697 RepID=A0A428JY92_9FLAO|nr:hypothetical protein [Mangrovimonas spongiae]RSK39107.1 hypothetical protein EJA19_09195 [Mangrovimonas spongiae]
MFLSHLVFVLSAIGFILFIIRSKNQEPFEKFLTFFSFLFFSSSGVWLYLDYYSDLPSVILDYYGVVNENLALLTPIFCASLFGKAISTSGILKRFGVIFLIGLSFAFIHYLIARDGSNSMIFYNTNKNILINIWIQIVYNLTLFGVFLYFLNKIEITKGNELFDGVYKQVFSVLFIVYYILDTLFFVGLILIFNNVAGIKALYHLTHVFNLIMTLLIITLAIYTNWLFLITKVKSKWQKEEPKEVLNEKNHNIWCLKDDDGKVKSWNDFKTCYVEEYKDLILVVEQLDFLTKTEKLYAALQPFNLSHKDLAAKFNVSLRTIETNFYRLRVKLRKQNYIEDYPYKSKE